MNHDYTACPKYNIFVRRKREQERIGKWTDEQAPAGGICRKPARVWISR
jgi:hypothetical protein